MFSNVSSNNSLECSSITVTAFNERLRLPHMDAPICDQEFSVLNRKLESKSEALRILRKKLEQSCNERDEFKLMAESLQLRYAMKGNNTLDVANCRDKSSVAALLHGTRDRNFKLSIELDGLKQKLKDVNYDLEVLRSSRGKVLPVIPERCMFSSNNQNQIQQWQQERLLLLNQLEALKRENIVLSSDMKFLVDENDEILKERDAYRCKAHRLNHELFTALKTNQYQAVIDVDSLLLENKYLHECLKNQELELQTAKENIDKYKTMLEAQSNKNSKTNYKENTLTENQVKQVIDSCLDLPTKAETINDLKELCIALFDKLSDNDIALSHQKNANKMLGKKITELEQRLQLLAGIREPNTEQYFSISQLLLEGSSSVTISSDKSSPIRDICEYSRTSNTEDVSGQGLHEFYAPTNAEDFLRENSIIAERQRPSSSMNGIVSFKYTPDRRESAASTENSFLSHVSDVSVGSDKISQNRKKCFKRRAASENDEERNMKSDELSPCSCSSPIDLNNLQNLSHNVCECGTPEGSSDTLYKIVSEPKTENRSFADATSDQYNNENRNGHASISPQKSNRRSDEGSFCFCSLSATLDNLQNNGDMCKCKLLKSSSDPYHEIHEELNSIGNQDTNKNRNREESKSPSLSTTDRNHYENINRSENRNKSRSPRNSTESENRYNSIDSDNIQNIPSVASNSIPPNRTIKKTKKQTYNVNECSTALSHGARETSSVFQILGSTKELRENKSPKSITQCRSIKGSVKAAENSQSINETNSTQYSKVSSNSIVPNDTKSLDAEQNSIEKATGNNSTKSISYKKGKSKQRSSSVSHIEHKKSISNARQTAKNVLTQPRHAGKHKLRLSRRSAATNSIKDETKTLGSASLGRPKIFDFSSSTFERNIKPGTSENRRRLTGGSFSTRSKSVSHASQTDEPHSSNLQKSFKQLGNSAFSAPSLDSHEKFASYENLLKFRNFIDNFSRSKHIEQNSTSSINAFGLKSSKSESLLMPSYDLVDKFEDNNKTKVEMSANSEEMRKDEIEQKIIENKVTEPKKKFKNSQEKQKSYCNKQLKNSEPYHYTQDIVPCKTKQRKNLTDDACIKPVKKKKKRCGTSHFAITQKYCSNKVFEEMDAKKFSNALKHSHYRMHDAACVKSSTQSTREEGCKYKILDSNELLIGTNYRLLQPDLPFYKCKNNLKTKPIECAEYQQREDCNMSHKNITILPFHNAKDEVKETCNKKESSSNSSSPKAVKIADTNKLYRCIDPSLSNEIYDENPVTNSLKNVPLESTFKLETLKGIFKEQPHSPSATKEIHLECDELVFTSASSDSEDSTASSVYSEVTMNENNSSSNTDDMYSRRETYGTRNRYMRTSIERERLAELSDLPPDIARICLQNLHELDEFDEMVSSAVKCSATCPPETE